MLAAMLLMAGPICTSSVGEEISKGNVTWGMSWIGDGPDGALILDIVPNGPADKLGLAPGDVIASVDGRPVKNSAELKERIKNSRPYTPVSIVVQRFGTRLEKTLLPTGALRLEVKDLDRSYRSFTIPGVPKTVFTPPSTALEALDNINVLQNVIIDRKSGQIAVVGSYDPKYATGPIPYLDLLKTALRYPAPRLSLQPRYDATKGVGDIRADDIIPVLFGLPTAEIERQAMLKAMAAAYRITAQEYVVFYNYAYSGKEERAAPADISRIFVKMIRNLRWDEVADAQELLASDNTDDLWRALKLLGKESQARELLAENPKDNNQIGEWLRIHAIIYTWEKLQLPVKEFRELVFRANAGEISPAQALDKMYKVVAVSMTDRDGRYLKNVALSKIVIGDAATRVLIGSIDPLPVRIEAIDLDQNSYLARIMYEADYAGKLFLVRPDLFEGVPGQKTYSEYMARKLEQTGILRGASVGTILDAEFWFEPKRVELEISPDNSVVSFGASEITFDTRMKAINSSSSSRKELETLHLFYNDWCKQYTDNYDLYAQIMPAFHSLREAAKVIALAKFLNDKKLVVDLNEVQQERWVTPESVPGLSRSGGFYVERSPKEIQFLTTASATGGVTFARRGWTSYGPASKTTEARVPDQLVLSSQLGKTAVQAAAGGDLEKARHYSELSAQALAGNVTRGELARQNIALPSARSAPFSPARVQLQKELLKETINNISALRQNPSDVQATANLGGISNVYDQVQSRPASATEYLRNLQIRRALPIAAAKEGAPPQAPAESRAPPPAAVPAAREAAYDCSLCDDGLRRNIRAKLDINPIRMLGTYVDGSISFYNNCKLKATKTCAAGDQFLQQVRTCDDRRADETGYYACINDLMSLRP